ncbi:MAG: CPBP family intramembrane metalloprotease [Anaerolineaceae bacterium]|nr:MAG: CPBP family intramembrane metalloprotease [Anaerolineaceae bacterium]
MHRSDPAQPMPMWESAIILVVITLLGIFCFYGVRPYLEKIGFNGYSAYLYSISIVFIVMILWSVIAYIREGNQISLKAFLNRTRLNRFRPNVIVWSFGLGLLMFLSTALFSPLISRSISGGFLPIPNGIPDYINPMKQQSISTIKNQLISNEVLLLIPVVLLLNIVGEELFWRGMIFPRQEIIHGNRTYLVHGAIWALSHLFQYWLLLPIFVGSIALSFAIQQTKNTWVGIIAHVVNNALPLVIMIFIPT